MHFLLRSKSLKTLLVLSLVLPAVSCGTILYPERRGQSSGRLDPKIVALDAVGLLAFFVPGVIAFAVDFNNGTIYLPPEESGELSANSAEGDGWTAVKVDAEELTAEKISAVIGQRTGKQVTLTPGTYQVRSVQNVENVATLMKSWPEEFPVAAIPTTVLFRAQSE